ncbi:MAG: DUF1178 family protein [Desulfobulbia bacterium]
MIRFSLKCQKSHEFEAWFRNSVAFEEQSLNKKVVCPHCGSTKVSKALMAPGISTSKSKRQQPDSSESRQMAKLLDSKYRESVKMIRQHIIENSEYVGDRFAEEARKIHYGEDDERGIHGEATKEDVEDLVDEGIDVIPIPENPDEKN